MFWKRKLRKIFRNNTFDVVHIHDLPLIKPVLKFKTRYAFKTVVDLHENWPGLLSISPHTKSLIGKLLCSIKQWQNYEKKYLNMADKIIVVVDEAKERILRLGISEKKIIIVSNTMNTEDYWNPKDLEKNNNYPKILIYEGGITYHRGIQYVLKAIARSNDLRGKIEFRIIGNGSYLLELKKLSHKLGLNETVRFMGWQNQEAVYENLAKSDLAIIPHIKSAHTDTTIPHKLFHYMYVGLPVIASDCNPIKRIINETSTGDTYEYNDIDELANLLETLIKRGTEKNLKGKAWVEKKYNWKSDSRNLLAAYNELESEQF